MTDRRLAQHFPELPPTSGRLVFWEQTDRWGRAFLQQMLRETQTPRDCPKRNDLDIALLAEQAVFAASIEHLRETVGIHPASFVIAETLMGTSDSPPKYRELLARIPHWRQAMPLLRVVALCLELPQRTVDEYDVFTTLFREAGCGVVLASRRELSAMIPAVLTHFSNIPQRQNDWRTNIEQQLPWRNV